LDPGVPVFAVNGTLIIAADIIDALRGCLRRLGVPDRHFAGHAFRRGGATSAAAVGLCDDDIKKVGRWRSNCFLRYVLPSVRSDASFSRLLAADV
jgi:hypothetical protein